MNNDIQSSIDAFRLAAQRYERSERYYNGQHDLRFATEKFENAFGTLFREFALNLCPIVCDAIRDKLRVVGFSADTNGCDACCDRYASEPDVSNTEKECHNRSWLVSRLRRITGTHRFSERNRCGRRLSLRHPTSK